MATQKPPAEVREMKGRAGDLCPAAGSYLFGRS
jgi:hypothetical protein